MDIERWQRLQELFERGRDVPTAGREAFLVEACAGDAALLSEVRRLLAADEEARDSLEPPSRTELEASLESPATEVGRRIGPYELQRLIGRGGMATVYLARRIDEHFEKEVALKLIRRGMDTEDILERFRNERQVLAGLEHPGIARLIDGGATEDGLPYLVMEYVDGQPLVTYCDQRGLPIRARVEIFRRICEAVQHAHEAHVVHRDLKPANVLITTGGEPKLLDFGIAKLLDESGSMRTAEVTVTELRLMTPEYASPEQVMGDKVSSATDVYSLGVMLYELLTGHRPYGSTVHQRSELERRICEEDPPRPSAVAGRAFAVGGREVLPSSGRGTTTGRLRRELAGDLDTVVSMALRKEPDRRYMTAGALADDLGRWLRGEPVLARPSTWTYRTKKFVRRNRTLVAASLAVFATLVAGLGVSLALYVDAQRERDAAVHRTYVAHVAAAAGSLRGGDVADARRNLERAPPEHRGWEWRHLWSRTDESTHTLTGHDAGVASVCWSRDGRLLASGSDDGSAIVWDADTGAALRRWEGLGGVVCSVSFSPDGGRLVVALRLRAVACLDVATGERLWTLDLPAKSARFDPSGERVVCVPPWRLCAVRSADGGQLAALRPPGGQLLQVAFDASRERVLFCAQTGLLGDWVPAEDDSRILVEGNDTLDERHWIEHQAFDSDGRVMATGSSDGALRIWSAETGELLREIPAHGERIPGLDLDPEGARVATASRDRSVKVWSVETGELFVELLGHVGFVQSVAFDPTGRILATASADRAVKLWDLAREEVPTLALDPGWRMGLALDPSGRNLAVGAWEGYWGPRCGLAMLDLTSRAVTWREIEDVPGAQGWANGAILAWSPDGSRIVASHHGEELLVWDPHAGRVIDRWPVEDGLVPLAFAPDGSTLAVGRERIRLLDPSTGEVRLEFSEPGREVAYLTFSPDGALLASSSHRGQARLWDVARGTVRARVPGRPGSVFAIAFHPDGERFATAGAEGRIRVWTGGAPELVATLEGHSATVRDLCFSPDGSRLFSVSVDQTLKVWDPDRCVEVATLIGHEAEADRLACSPDGTLLVSQDRRGHLRFWGAPWLEESESVRR